MLTGACFFNSGSYKKYVYNNNIERKIYFEMFDACETLKQPN